MLTRGEWRGGSAHNSQAHEVLDSQIPNGALQLRDINGR
jgi:hypothetical protein